MKREKIREGFETDGPLLHNSHKRPITRRQLLGQGFLTGAAMVMSPSLFGLLGKSNDAYAQLAPTACALTGAGAGFIPFVCFDLAGGAIISGSNVLVGGPGGQLDLLSDAGYEKLGLPAAQNPRSSHTPVVDTSLNLAFHNTSAMLLGILDKASPTTLAKVDGFVVPARSANDTGNNPLNPMYGINRYGADGGLVPLIGTRSSDSGGNSMAPASMIDPSKRPTKVERPADATGLVDTGKLVSLLQSQGATDVMQAVREISAWKVDKISEPTAVKTLINCAYEQSGDLISIYGNPNLLDPRQDINITGDATSIFTAADMTRSEFQKTASVMKLVLEGHAGAGTIQFGGYDYHDSTRTTGDSKDFRAGQAIGAVLEFAERSPLCQDLMIYVFTDGSVASNGQTDSTGKGIWKGDNSSTAAVFMLAYRKSGKPDLVPGVDTSRQIGWMRSDASVETSAFSVSNNPQAVAEMVVLNYIALHNNGGSSPQSVFSSLYPTNAISSDIASLVGFQPIR